jgi:site-specific DNA recombinase
VSGLAAEAARAAFHATYSPAIVSDQAWAKAQEIHSRYDHLAGHKARRPKHLFSGLLKCGRCGAGYTVKNRDP